MSEEKCFQIWTTQKLKITRNPFKNITIQDYQNDFLTAISQNKRENLWIKDSFAD